MALHRDGKMLASGSYDHTTRLWDLDTGQGTILHQVGKTDSDWFPLVTFSPDGKTLAFSYVDPTPPESSHAELRDLATGKTRRTIKNIGRGPMLFDTTGRLLAIGSGTGEVTLWDVERGNLVARFPGNSIVMSMALSVDGKTLATCHASTGGGVVLWDVATAKCTGVLESPTPPGGLASVAFSPDGKWLASGGGLGGGFQNVILWNPATRKHVATLEGHTHLVAALAFSPDSKILASGSLDHTIRLWDITQALKHKPDK
jgi:WD40 repeat protein